jgi:hypothetical protein
MSRFTIPTIAEVLGDDPLADMQPIPEELEAAVQLSTRDAVLRITENRDTGETTRIWEVSVFARSNAFDHGRTIHFASETPVRPHDSARAVSESFALEVVSVIAQAIKEARDE